MTNITYEDIVSFSRGCIPDYECENGCSSHETFGTVCSYCCSEDNCNDVPFVGPQNSISCYHCKYFPELAMFSSSACSEPFEPHGEFVYNFTCSSGQCSVSNFTLICPFGTNIVNCICLQTDSAGWMIGLQSANLHIRISWWDIVFLPQTVYASKGPDRGTVIRGCPTTDYPCRPEPYCLDDGVCVDCCSEDFCNRKGSTDVANRALNSPMPDQGETGQPVADQDGTGQGTSVSKCPFNFLVLSLTGVLLDWVFNY